MLDAEKQEQPKYQWNDMEDLMQLVAQPSAM
jgi:hypothetical protein